MRLKDRVCNQPEFIDEILSKADTLFLALQDGDFPYCLPVNFARVENRIYFHSALQGHKLDCICHNPKVAFSAAIDIEIDTNNSTTYFKSVCGTAIAKIVENEAEKALALDAIGEHYHSKCQRPAPPKDTARVAIVCLEIVTITGKRNLPE